MMWQILTVVMLVWFAVSIGAGVLVGHVLRRSGVALGVSTPQPQADGPSSLDMVRAG